MGGVAKKNKKTKAKPSPATSTPPNLLPAEERSAEVATVAWMLTALITAAAEFVALLARLYFYLQPEPPESMAPLALLPGIMLIIGLIAGGLCLLLTPLIYKIRKSPPPFPITVVVVLISLIPPITLVLRWLRM
jgi:hypothetical protein